MATYAGLSWTLLSRHPSLSVGIVLALVATATLPVAAQAQIAPDTTLGSENSTVTPGAIVQGNVADLIEGGALRGSNLFHSFLEFNVNEAQRVYFATPAGIESILSRITGNDPSLIFGTLGVDGPADLFLMNPNGFMFGPNATLDVQGSLAITTADYIQLGVDGSFSAIDPTSDNLLMVDPSVFWFSELVQSEGIEVAGANLQVPPREALMLVGGEILINGGQLNAPSGYIGIGSIQSVGTVPVIFEGGSLRMTFPEDIARGDITLTNNSQLSTVGTGGGEIEIFADNFLLGNQSIISSGIGFLELAFDQAGDILIDADRNVDITDGSEILNSVGLLSIGNSGNILIKGRERIDISNNSTISNSINFFADGNAGNISITTDGDFILSATGKIQSIVNSGSTGDTGNIFITGNNLELFDGAEITAVNQGLGSSGDIKIQAIEDITIQGFDQVVVTSVFTLDSASLPEDTTNGDLIIFAQNLSIDGNTRLSTNSLGVTPVLPSGNISITVKDDIILSGADVEIRADTSGDGAAGNIAINTGSFFAENGAGLSTGNLRGKGSGGNIIILAEDVISFSGVGTIPSSALVATAAEGNSGSIIFDSRLLSITDGAQILADTLSTGQGGDIFIDAEQVLIEGGNFLEGSSKASVSGIFATSQPEADGDSGSIEFQIDTLTMNSGAQLAVGTGGSGDAGDIIVTATGPILVNGIGIEEIVTEITAETGQESTGRGGKIDIRADSLSVTNGARLNVSNSGIGNAGRLTLEIADVARFDGVSVNGNASGAFSRITESGVGTGGDVQVTAVSLDLSNGAVLSTENLGRGNAGSIILNLQNQLRANNGTISTVASSGSGGRIEAAADNIFLEGDSDITTFVNAGAGTGGNITLTAEFIIALDESDILAFSADGIGGNIFLDTPAFFGENFQPTPQLVSLAELQALDGNDRVDINATGRIASGTISLPDVSFIENSLTELSGDLVTTTTLIAGSCIVHTDSTDGSFIITGADGLPQQPGTDDVAGFPTGEVRGSDGAISEQVQDVVGQRSHAVLEPTGAYELNDGRLVLSHECN